MACDVFLSYSTHDCAAADEVVAHLERAGLRVWYAPRDVAVGAAYGQAIINAIDGARALVLILSSSSNSSEQVAREVEHADKRRLPIFPLRLAEVIPEGSLAYFVSSVQFLDAWTPPLAPHLDRLAEGVRAKLAVEGAPALPAPPRARPVRRVPTAVVAVVSALAGALGTAAVMRARKPAAAPEPAPIVIDFNYDLTGQPNSAALAERYLRKFGISIVDVTPNTGVLVVAKRHYDATKTFTVDGGSPDVLVQSIAGYGFTSYTMVFTQPLRRVDLHRPATAGTDLPDWTARAFASDGRTELAVGGEQGVAINSPGFTETLIDPTDQGIYRVRIESSQPRTVNMNVTAIDGLTLYPKRQSSAE